MQKRGISGVVVTVLLILIALVIIGILIVVVKPLVSKSTKEAGIIGSTCINVKLEPVRCTYEGGIVQVDVRRGVGKGELTDISFLFEKDDGTVQTLRNATSLKEVDTGRFQFSAANPKTVNVAAVTSGNSCNPLSRPIACNQPVCGNGNIEAGEQCEGSQGSSCIATGTNYMFCGTSLTNQYQGHNGCSSCQQTSCVADVPLRPYCTPMQNAGLSLSIDRPRDGSDIGSTTEQYTLNVDFVLTNQTLVYFDVNRCFFEFTYPDGRLSGVSEIPSCQATHVQTFRKDFDYNLNGYGNYKVTIYVNTSLGGMGAMSSFNLVDNAIQLNHPLLYIPYNSTASTNGVSVPLNFTLENGFNPQACWYSVDGINNISLPSCISGNNYYEVLLQQGIYDLKLYANTSAGANAETDVRFGAWRCLGNLNWNEPPNTVIDFVDLGLALSEFNCLVGSGSCHDRDGDGDLDGTELSYVLTDYGRNNC